MRILNFGEFQIPYSKNEVINYSKVIFFQNLFINNFRLTEKLGQSRPNLYCSSKC